ncbi:MAG TPA: hypothetical protein VKU38_16495 [Ktedonobacteraceae bacterium]|nr:hypothetical protein [Ktedonobacteraceae bacterium]
MSNQDDFFTPEEVDRQINQVIQHREGEQADAEVIACLRSFYGIDTQQEQGMLDRVWSRIEDAAFPLQDNLQQRQKRERGGITMQNQPALVSNMATHRRSTTLMQRLSVLAAVIFLVALVGSMAILFYSIRHNAGGPATGGPKPGPSITAVPPTSTPLPTPTPTTRPVPFKVTSVAISVTPGSIADIACGTNLTVTYMATIHVMPHGPGGTVQFGYTVNNGRSHNTASVTFAPGETSKTYSFMWSGALPADHTYPEPGGIDVTSPNQLLSSLVGPSGTCVSTSAFVVTGVNMAVSPVSIQGLTCGTSIVVTYTATIHVATNGPGGIVQFSYTVNNGRGQNPASVTFASGETSKTYSFTWSGALPADHTYPEPGGIDVTSPNQLLSPLVGPSGTCN